MMNIHSNHSLHSTFALAKLDEAPVAVCINGISHAVMMTTPAYLHDFALGFALSEGLINSPCEVLDIKIKRLS